MLEQEKYRAGKTGRTSYMLEHEKYGEGKT